MGINIGPSYDNISTMANMVLLSLTILAFVPLLQAFTIDVEPTVQPNITTYNRAGLFDFSGMVIGPTQTSQEMVYYRYGLGRPARACTGYARPPGNVRHFQVLAGHLFGVTNGELKFYR